MKIGLNIVPVAMEMHAEVAQLAERLGYESVWSGEHVAMRADLDAESVGRRHGSGSSHYQPQASFPDPMVTLAHVAAATTQIRLGTGVWILPLRHPLLAAKTIATVDRYSGGRLDVGIGVGWNEDEFNDVGADFATRGRRTDEMLAVMDAVFAEGIGSFEGEFYRFPPVGFEPRPLQRPRPPIHVGGMTAPALRRAALHGDGWYGSGNLGDRLPAVLDKLRAERDKVNPGRPLQITLLTLGDAPPAETLENWTALGVHRVVVTPWATAERTNVPGEVGQDAGAMVAAYAERIGMTSAEPG